MKQYLHQLSIGVLALGALALPTLLSLGAGAESRIDRDNMPRNSIDTTPTDPTGTPTNPPSSPSSSPASSPTASGPRFSCEQVSGSYTVVYRPQSRPSEAYPWATPAAMGSAWSAQRRCGEIARRLENYRPDGLQELRTGIENRQNVVCVTTEKDQNCRIVFTVPPRQDPASTRDQVFRNLTLADSGQQTAGVNTWNNGSDDGLGGLGQVFNGGGNQTPRVNNRRSGNGAIDLRPFLDGADGGNGSRMGNPVRVPANYRLNPDNFR